MVDFIMLGLAQENSEIVTWCNSEVIQGEMPIVMEDG